MLRRHSRTAEGRHVRRRSDYCFRSAVQAAALIWVASALVACDDPSGPANSIRDSTSASVLGSIQSSERDFESYFWPDTADERAYRIKLEERIAGCMKARGFAYPPAGGDAGGRTQQSRGTATTERDYGLVDSILHGGETAIDGTVSGLRAYIDTLDEVERQQLEMAFWGDPSDATSIADSCTNKANGEVSSSIPRFQPQYQRILDDYYSRLASDPRIGAATTEWARCLEQATGLLQSTNSPLILSRSNVVLAVRADLAVRLRKAIRWISEAEAEQLDTSSLAQPEVSIDETGIGLLVYGVVAQVDLASVDSARARERQVWSASERCWVDSGGSAAISELQADAMKEAEPLIAAASN